MNTSRMVKVGLLGLTLLLSTMALAQDVAVRFDNSFDFGRMKTFVVKIGTSWGNDVSEKRFISEFETALISKGWTKADETSADAMVLLHGATQQKKDLNTFYTGFGGWGYFGWGGGIKTGRTVLSDYKIGVLVADIFDARAKRLVYRGIAQDEISTDSEKSIVNIQNACAKMFKNFPPTPTK